MAITYVNKQAYGTESGSLSSVTFNGVTAGNALIVIYDRPSRVISDNLGNRYKYKLITHESDYAGYGTNVSYCKVQYGGNLVIELPEFTQNVIIYEFSGLVNPEIDKTMSARISGSGSPVSSGATATTAYSNELLIGVAVQNMFGGFAPNSSVGSGYSNFIRIDIDNGSRAMAAETRVVTATGSYSATFGMTGSHQGAVRIITFYDKVSSPPSVELELPEDESSVESITPTFSFVGTDPDGDPISYQIQIDTDDSFSSPVIDTLSSSVPTFTNLDNGTDTDPFNSGEVIGVSTYIKSVYTYYFNSVAWSSGITNAGNMVNGNISDYSTVGDEASASLIGTNAPSSGTETILGVRGRVHDGTSWGGWVSLSEPEGGWSWDYLRQHQAFSVDAYMGGISGYFEDSDQYSTYDPISMNSHNIARVEIAVDYPALYELSYGTTYYWRVRGVDPSDSNTWGNWSSVRRFDVGSSGGNFLTFFYP